MSSKRNTIHANEHHVGKLYTYEGPCTSYGQPQELTCYSIDKDSKVWFDDREKRYYSPPKSGIKDLTEGFDQFIEKDINTPEHLDALLDALTDLKIKTNQEHKADIVTLRGILAKILRTPYSRREPWEFRATRYNGTIFIEEQVTEEKRQYELGRSMEKRLQCYSGYKFKALTTAKKPFSELNKNDQELGEDSTKVLNNNAQFYTVVKTQLGNNTIIMGAELDCCLDRKLSNPLKTRSNYIELTTVNMITSENQQNVFNRHKLLKYWTQSYLIGAPTIICAFRDSKVQVVDIQEIDVFEIPKEVRKNSYGKTWDPVICLNFANELLNWIISKVSRDDPTVTYSTKFEYPFYNVTIDCAGHSNIFLTQRFIDGTTQNAIGGPRAQIAHKENRLDLAFTNMSLL